LTHGVAATSLHHHLVYIAAEITSLKSLKSQQHQRSSLRQHPCYHVTAGWMT